MARIRASMLLGVLCAVAQAGVVQAQSDDERAHQHFQAGRSYFDQARYEDAEREFVESYRLSRRPALLINVAAARERALDFAGAVEALEQYLAEEPDADDRTTIETRMARLRELGARQPRAGGAGEEVGASSEGAAGDAGAEDAASSRAEPMPAAEDDGGGSWMTPVGFVSAGLGVVAAGVAIGLFVARGSAIDEWNSDECWDSATSSRATLCADERDAADTYQAAGIASAVGAAVFAGLGVTLVVLDGGESSEEAQASVVCAPGMGSIVCEGRF